ncbi:MAG: J domain-containing protein, partial [Bryobacteraceae bacterium]
MNYYEELGLTPEATPEEIHQAHRKLTKLLHPDQQTDEALRRLAEAQMRRLNSIVDVLSDSDSRKQYDKGVNAPNGRPHYTPNAANLGMAASMEREDPRQFLTRIRRYVPWWVWSTVGALTLTLATVWFFADDLGSSIGGKSMGYVPPQDPPAQSGSGASAGPPPASNTRESRAEARLQDLTARLRSVFETKPNKPQVSDAGGPQRNPAGSRNEVAVTVPQTTVPEQAAPPPPVVATPKAASHNDGARDTELALTRQAPPKIDSTPVASIPAPLAQTPSVPKPAPPPQPTPAPAVNSQSAPATASASTSTQPTVKPVVPVAQSGLEGEWIYAPAKP